MYKCICPDCQQIMYVKDIELFVSKMSEATENYLAVNKVDRQRFANNNIGFILETISSHGYFMALCSPCLTLRSFKKKEDNEFAEFIDSELSRKGTY